MPFRAATITVILTVAGSCPAGDEILTPVVDGDWWQIAGNPDLGEYTRPGQQPVDFAVWQAADGTWQLWSCIRHTGRGGHTRLLYRWEGKHLTDANWQPMGIAMQARPDLGEQPGGLQAPHVVKHDGQYVMAYGDWENICFATSRDGKHFERVIQPSGKTAVFGEGPGANARDPMLVEIDGLWHCYYTASPDGRGYAYCRTSPDLKTWSDSCVVSYGGQVGPGPWHNECPQVAEPKPGVFYFFRNQYYGEGARNFVYRSTNPLNFGIDDDSKMIGSWPVAAPEIVRADGKWYVAALNKGLDGVRLARLKWVALPELGPAVFDFDAPQVRETWTLDEGDLAGAFTDSQRSAFDARTRFFIGTAETGGGRFDDARTGVIESPPFRLERPGYTLFVSGGNDREQLYVALVEADSGREIAHLTGDDNNRFRKHVVDCSAWQGKRAKVRVVDRAKGPWGHINFGGIYEAPAAAAAPTPAH